MIPKTEHLLKLDYTIECNECGTVDDALNVVNEHEARKEFAENGWTLIDGENRCADCATIN